MADQIHELQSIPLKDPCLLSSALADFDQSQLLGITKGVTPYLPAQLSQLVDLAVAARCVSRAKVQVEGHGILDYVERETFVSELNQFIGDVAAGRSDVSLDVVLSKMALRTASAPKTSVKSLMRDFLGYVATKPKLLPLAEVLCRNDLGQLFRLSGMSVFAALQKKEEFLALLNLLHEKQPKAILEIGTCNGGTMYMFSKVAAPNANIVTMDLKIPNRELLESFGRKGRTIAALEGDSTSSTTIQVIKNRFPNGIDFLFIDGDHSYEGVKRDFVNYSPMVNTGGVIAFHDIVPDNLTRYGVSTGGYAGGVHTFWKEIKGSYQHHEFIANPKQDGAGIGALIVS